MAGGVFGFFGLKRLQQKQRRGRHEQAAEIGHSRGGSEVDRSRSRQLRAVYETEILEPWQRKVRRTDEDNGRWVAGFDIDRKAKQYIDRVHRSMSPDQLLEAH